MTVILAIDASDAICSVALQYQGVVQQKLCHHSKQYTQRLLPMIWSLLAEADCDLSALDAIAVTVGPGRFTGLRVAAGVVQGLAFAIDCPVLAVSSLQALAQGLHAANPAYQQIAVATDAHMGQLYWGCFAAQAGWCLPVAAEQLLSPEQVTVPFDHDWVAAGQGWQVYAQALSVISQTATVQLPKLHVSAAIVVQLAQQAYDAGHQLKASELSLVYLRDSRAWKTLDQQ